MAKTMGPREEQLRALRAAKVAPRSELRPARRPAERPAAALAAPEPAPEAIAPEKPKEPTMKKPAKAKDAQKTPKKTAPATKPQATASAKTAPKGKVAPAKKNAPAASASANGTGVMPRPGSKNELMLNMVLAPKGATEAAICKELGWVRCRVTLRRVCAKAGATLTSDGTGEERVYKATLPAAA